MNHCLIVALWLRFSTPATRAEAARDPRPLLLRMSRLCALLGPGWWFLIVQLMFWSVWHNPACFWYAIPLLVSLGMVGYGMVGEACAGEDYVLSCDSLWEDPESDRKWPREYRQRAWQLELAQVLLGQETLARLQSEALNAGTAETTNTPVSRPRL